MSSDNGVVVTYHMRNMIRKYAAEPQEFGDNGSASQETLDRTSLDHIEIDDSRRDGKACIKGTRIAVCDIIFDSCALQYAPGFEDEMYGGAVPREAIDWAYAFFLRNPDKVSEAFLACYGSQLPQELYNN